MSDNTHKIEAIIICVNYADLLSITLSKNIQYLDSAIIVTDSKDKDTINACREINSEKIKTISTDAFYLNGAKFNKGLAINVGINYITYKDWILNLDSDILLSDNFREKFLAENPNKDNAYGCRRRDIPTKEEYEKFISGEKKIEDFILYRGSGYGYLLLTNYRSAIFQWMSIQNNGLVYPAWFPNGADSDWVYRNYWGERVFNPPLKEFPQSHFELNNDYDTGRYRELPFHCIHLGMVGQNHDKRVTEKFV